MNAVDKKDRRFGGYSQIEVGDEVAIDSRYGPCSGGARYGVTQTVILVTDEAVVTKNGQYSRVTGAAIVPPYAYGIEWWISSQPRPAPGDAG